MYQHTLGADWLESSSGEKDLEVLVDSKLTTSHQCVVKKGNIRLGFIRKSTAISLRYILPLYSAIVRHIWSAGFAHAGS